MTAAVWRGGWGGAKVFKMCGFSSVDLSRDGEVALGLCVEGDFCSLVAGISAVTLVMDLLDGQCAAAIYDPV